MASSNRIPQELQSSIKELFKRKGNVLLKCPVRMETKGDRTENKVMVFTAFRVFIVAAKIPTKIDFHFNYLEIQSIESKKPNQLSLVTSDRACSVFSLEPDSVDVDIMISHMGSSIKAIFPNVSLEEVVHKVDVIPADRIQKLFDAIQNGTKRDIGPCGGFSRQYACTCDCLMLPYRDEVAWDVDTIYLSHDTKELSLHDFDHLEVRDLVPIIAALEHNRWFTKLRASHIKLTPDAAEQILIILRKNPTIEELYFDNIGFKWEFVHKMSVALMTNNQTSLHTMDLSNNIIEDKGLISLCKIIEKITQGAAHVAKTTSKIPKGLVHLNLAKTGLTSKGVNTLAHALSINKFMSTTLTYLNLADNLLKDEVNNLYNFLAQPNSLTQLDLSGTECSIDMLFGALLRGCCQKLSHINLSRNAFTHKKSKDSIVPPSFKQFFSASIGLKYLNISASKIPLEALKHLLLGLVCNESASDVELDLSGNGLSTQGAHLIETCIPEIKCLSSLDLSDNALEGELASVITAISKNRSIKRLSLGRNITNLKAKHVSMAMEALVQLIQEEDSVLEYLSLADSRLKSDIHNLINALGSNQCLVTIDISGNQMGDSNARLLAKAVQINNRLRAIIYDRNNISAQGFHDLAYAMESNYSIRYMPFPLHDAMVAMKQFPDKTETALRKIENLLHRNVSPKKFSNGQGFRLQQGFLLSSTQQMVDKLVVQTQDTVSMLRQAGGDGHKECLDKASGYIQDANNSKMLLTRFHEVVLQREESDNPVELKLASLSKELSTTIEQHLQGTLSSMIKAAEEQCPNIVGNERTRRSLQQACSEKSTLPKDFVSHCIMEQAGTDILNKLNELHLVVAAQLSDRIVDQVIDVLNSTHRSLLTVSHQRHSMTPEVRRNRTRIDSDSSFGEVPFGTLESCESPRHLEWLQLATPQLSSKRKTVHSRKLRPQSVVDEEFLSELPGGSDQKLEHLVKDRPKRAKTRAATRPTVKTASDTKKGIVENQDLNEGLETFFHNVPSLDLSTSTLPENKSTPSVDSLDVDKFENYVNKVETNISSSQDKKSPMENEAQKKDSFREKNSKSFIKGLNNVFGRSSSQDKFQRSKSMEQTERVVTTTIKTDVPAPATVKEEPVKSESIEKVTPDPVKRRVAGLSKIGMGGDVLAEMRARQEKRMSTIGQIKVEGQVQKEADLSSLPPQPPSPRRRLKPNNSQSSIFSSPESSPSEHSSSKLNSSNESNNLSMAPGATKLQEDDSTDNSNLTSYGKVKPPPPIAPKPRPRSMIGVFDDRRSGDFSPSSNVSSGEPSTVNSPEGFYETHEDGSTDSGLMGSRDSLTPAKRSSSRMTLGDDDDDDGDCVDGSDMNQDDETSKVARRIKAASLPRNMATPSSTDQLHSPAEPSVSRSHSLGSSHDAAPSSSPSLGGHNGSTSTSITDKLILKSKLILESSTSGNSASALRPVPNRLSSALMSNFEVSGTGSQISTTATRVKTIPTFNEDDVIDV